MFHRMCLVPVVVVVVNQSYVCVSVWCVLAPVYAPERGASARVARVLS